MIGTIIAIYGHPSSGLAHIVFDNSAVAYIDSGYGLKSIEDCFGSVDNAIGQRVVYETDWLGVMEWFEPIEVD